MEASDGTLGRIATGSPNDCDHNYQPTVMLHACKEERGSGAEKRRIVWNVTAISLAFMLLYSAWSGVSNLQSSINGSNGLGTATLLSSYIGLVLSNCFLSVSVVRWLGCKWAMAVPSFSCMLYVLAQAKAEFYTLIPASLITGISGGPLWCGKSTYLSFMAVKYNELTDVPIDTLTIRFFGIFYMIFQLSQVWGNLISSLVFSVGVDANVTEDVGQVCGANFCPTTPTITNNTNLSRPSDEKIYTLTGIYLGCVALAICLIAVGVDSLKRYNKDNRQDSTTGMNGLQLLVVTVKMLKEPRQLLLIPIITWLGIEQAFIGAEFTAAYVSCAWGVRNIGFVLICYGVVTSVSALSMGPLVKLAGRVPIMTTALVITLALVATLLLWTPTARDKPTFFVVSGLWGASGGAWLVQINAMCGILFPGREEAAYSNYELWKSLGYIIAYAYSSSLCTDMKLYIVLVLLLFGMAGYYVIEWQLRREAAHDPATDKQ